MVFCVLKKVGDEIYGRSVRCQAIATTSALTELKARSGNHFNKGAERTARCHSVQAEKRDMKHLAFGT
jgi:hypothetical protein